MRQEPPRDAADELHDRGESLIEGAEARADLQRGPSTIPKSSAHGRLLFRRPDGRIEVPHFATFSLGEPGAKAVTVHVRDGDWSVGRFSSPRTVSNIVIHGLEARALEPLLQAQAETHVIEAVAALRGQVRVLDARSGLELTGVTVARARSVEETSRTLPPPEVVDTALIVGASSPLEVPDSPGMQCFWVGAEGYAWSQLHLAEHDDGDYVVKLERSGALELTLPIGDGWHRTLLTVVGDGEDSRVAYREEVTLLDGLRLPNLLPGEYRVELRYIGTGGVGALLDATLARVASGGVTQLLLDRDRRAAELAELDCNVFLPEAPDLPWSLRLRTVGEGRESDVPQRIPSRRLPVAGASLRSIRLHGMEPGAWEVALEPLGVTQHVVLAPGGRGTVDLAVDLLGTVELQARDAATGELLRSPRVSLSGPESEFAFLCASRFERVYGSFELSVSVPGYSLVTLPVELLETRLRLAVELDPLPTHHHDLRLSEGDRAFVVEEGFWRGITIEGTDGGRSLGVSPVSLGRFDPMPRTSYAAAQGRMFVEDPGSYRLSFPRIEGYQDLADVTVSVSEAAAGATEVRLVALRD